MEAVLGIIVAAFLLVIIVTVVYGCKTGERDDDPHHCTRCGKEISEVKPCPYNYFHYHSCDECCEECHKYEPFECEEYYKRKEKTT